MDNKKILKNIGAGLFCKPISIALNLVIFPLTINFFSEETYGIWITIFSFVSWINLFDIGIGNGLKNKLTQSLVEKNYSKSKQYVATSYIALGTLALVLFIVFFIISFYIEWNKVFNVTSLTSHYLRKVILLNIFFMCLNFILKLSDNIYFAFQNIAYIGLFQVITQIFNLLILIIVIKNYTFENKLLILSALFGISNLIVQIFSTYIIFTRYKELRFSILDFNKRLMRDLLNLGGKFFVMQIAGLIIFTTDNMIITQIYGPKEVTVYNVTFKIFSLITIIHGVIMTPLWTAFTQAYYQRNRNWIIRIIRNLRLLEILIFIGTILIYFFFPFFLKYWIKVELTIPKVLKIGFGYYVLLTTWNSIQSNVLNGFGRIEHSYKVSMVEGVINIPLSIYLAKNMNMGIAGVIWGTNLTLMISAIINYILLKKVLKEIE